MTLTNVEVKKILVISFVALKGCFVTWQSQSGTLRDEITIVQRNQAELASQLKKLLMEVKALDEKITTVNTRLTLLSQKVDDLQSTLLSKIDSFYQHISGTPELILAPSESYRIAYSNYLKGNYSLAIMYFKTFLEKNPSSELAPQAQYYLADSYNAKGDLEKAIAEFSSLLVNYPKSEFVPTAMLKHAQCLIKLNKPDEATVILKKLVNNYPGTLEATQANEVLKSIETSQKR